VFARPPLGRRSGHWRWSSHLDAFSLPLFLSFFLSLFLFLSLCAGLDWAYALPAYTPATMDSLLEQQRRAHEELERLEAAMVLELSEHAKTVRTASGAP